MARPTCQHSMRTMSQPGDIFKSNGQSGSSRMPRSCDLQNVVIMDFYFYFIVSVINEIYRLFLTSDDYFIKKYLI